MSRHLYTQAEQLWLECNLNKSWESRDAFVKAFNKKFKTDISVDALANYIVRHTKAGYISVKTNDCFYTDEQIKWICENANAITFKSIQHFVDTFNAVFGTNKTKAGIAKWLSSNSVSVKTRVKQTFSEAGDKWLKSNIQKYDVFMDLFNAYRDKFNADVNYASLATHCEYLGIKQRVTRKELRNRGQFKKNAPRSLGELPVGTIRYNSQGRPYIKVMLCNGASRSVDNQRHNYKEPFWKPLQKKIWEDNYGPVPDGYVVCSLNGDITDTDVRNIGLIDKRATPIMSKQGWWTDNRVITADGVQWCNLYMIAKDNGVK